MDKIDQKIVEEVIYKKNGVVLKEVKVMLMHIEVAHCWQEWHKGELFETYYSMPMWYRRYKKLKEIL